MLVLDAHVPGGRARVTAKDGFVFNRGLHALYRAGAGWDVRRFGPYAVVHRPRPVAAGTVP